MTKYHFAYSGGATPSNEAEQKKTMENWMAWFGVLGDSIVDPGNPFGPSKSVSANGVNNAGAAGLIGYTLVNAINLDAAVELAKGCPIISEGGFVDVYEEHEMG